MEVVSLDGRVIGNAGGVLYEQRLAPRFYSLIRAAKLVAAAGEFVCVVRDVSSSGVRLRCYHTPPPDRVLALGLQNGEIFEMECVRSEGDEASYRFLSAVPVERLVQESSAYPRRPLRLNIAVPLSLWTATGSIAAITRNISQQGCRIDAAQPLALDQALRVGCRHLPGIRAKVRWRHEGSFGLVFDDTFSLKDFAIHTARLQCPSLTTA